MRSRWSWVSNTVQTCVFAGSDLQTWEFAGPDPLTLFRHAQLLILTV